MSLSFCRDQKGRRQFDGMGDWTGAPSPRIRKIAYLHVQLPVAPEFPNGGEQGPELLQGWKDVKRAMEQTLNFGVERIERWMSRERLDYPGLWEKICGGSAEEEAFPVGTEGMRTQWGRKWRQVRAVLPEKRPVCPSYRKLMRPSRV